LATKEQFLKLVETAFAVECPKITADTTKINAVLKTNSNNYYVIINSKGISYKKGLSGATSDVEGITAKQAIAALKKGRKYYSVKEAKMYIKPEFLETVGPRSMYAKAKLAK